MYVNTNSVCQSPDGLWYCKHYDYWMEKNRVKGWYEVADRGDSFIKLHMMMDEINSKDFAEGFYQSKFHVKNIPIILKEMDFCKVHTFNTGVGYFQKDFIRAEVEVFIPDRSILEPNGIFKYFP